jgi:hypothetical protein
VTPFWNRPFVAVLLAGLLAVGCTSPGGNTNDNAANSNANDNGGGSNTNDNVSNGNTNANDNSGTDEQPALIKTRISFSYGSPPGSILDASGKLDAGDDLIVYGIDTRGIFYIIPSEVDVEELPETGSAIPNSDTLFDERSFVVAGKKVALVRSTFAVSIYDTTTATLVDIPSGEILLDRFRVPVDANQPGQMTADGALIATLNDAGEVTDGHVVKVIDTTSDTPEVISFATPADFEGTFNQVCVDADSRRVAAHGDNPGDMLYVWSIDDPTAPPLAYDFSIRGGFSDNIQFRFDHDLILFQSGVTDGDWNIALLDVNSGTVTLLDHNPTQNEMPVAMAGGSFGYFVWREDADKGPGFVDYRSAIGALESVPAATLAAQADVYAVQEDACVDGGKIGYGSTLAITPNGERWFLAGFGPIETQFEELQMSTGGAFSAFEDPDADTQTGWVMASDVVASGSTVAFRALRQTSTSGCLTDDDWVLGFIVLDRLAD